MDTDIVFYTRLSYYKHENRGTEREWVAFNRPDVQMEFFMLDPYYRLDMKIACPFSGTYKQFLKTPHKLGIYKLKVHFWRYGFPYLDYEKEVSNIQLRHDQHPRWIKDALPNYVSVACALLGFTLFTLAFAFSDFETDKKKKTGEEEKSKNSKEE